MTDIESIIQKIIAGPLFIKLKEVVENNSHHDNETTYNHLLKTFRIAKENIGGKFIEDPQARKLFLEFTNSTLEELKVGDIMLITALVHDSGKLLYYRDGENERSLRHNDDKGVTKMPGHEYWGSTIIPQILKEVQLSAPIVEKIAKVVRLHDTFSDPYFKALESLSIEEIVDDVKARAEGFYKEALFNMYCDVNTATPSVFTIKRIAEVFSQPSLYTLREYFIK